MLYFHLPNPLQVSHLANSKKYHTGKNILRYKVSPLTKFTTEYSSTRSQHKWGVFRITSVSWEFRNVISACLLIMPLVSWCSFLGEVFMLFSSYGNHFLMYLWWFHSCCKNIFDESLTFLHILWTETLTVLCSIISLTSIII